MKGGSRSIVSVQTRLNSFRTQGIVTIDRDEVNVQDVTCVACCMLTTVEAGLAAAKQAKRHPRSSGAAQSPPADASSDQFTTPQTRSALESQANEHIRSQKCKM